MSKIKEMAERIYLQSRQRHRTHGRAVRSQAHTEHGSLLLQLQRGRAHLCANQTAVLHCAESKVRPCSRRETPRPPDRAGIKERAKWSHCTVFPPFAHSHVPDSSRTPARPKTSRRNPRPCVQFTRARDCVSLQNPAPRAFLFKSLTRAEREYSTCPLPGIRCLQCN